MEKISGKRGVQLNVEIEQLEKDLPFSNYLKLNKLSKLRVMRAACAYLKKEKHFANIKSSIMKNEILDNVKIEQQFGFIVCFSTKGELIYLSDNVIDHLGFNSTDILFTHDSIFELICDQDLHAFKTLLNEGSYQKKKITMFSNWFVSKIKRKNITNSEFKLLKMTGSFDNKTNLFVFTCESVLTRSNKDSLLLNDPFCFKTLNKINLEFSELSAKAVDLLGYSIEDVEENKMSLYHILSGESLTLVSLRHKELLNTKVTKNYLDHVKLVTKEGLYINCLMNMCINSKNFILCSFQLMNESEYIKYNDYLQYTSRVALSKTHDSPEFNFDYEDLESLDDGEIEDEECVGVAKRKRVSAKRKTKNSGPRKAKIQKKEAKQEKEEDEEEEDEEETEEELIIEVRSVESTSSNSDTANRLSDTKQCHVSETNEIETIKNSLIDELKYIDNYISFTPESSNNDDVYQYSDEYYLKQEYCSPADATAYMTPESIIDDFDAGALFTKDLLDEVLYSTGILEDDKPFNGNILNSFYIGQDTFDTNFNDEIFLNNEDMMKIFQNDMTYSGNILVN